MSFETSGADYLRRLKQDENQQSRAYIEPAPAPAPADTEQAQPERRRNPRYKCEGSAAFRVRGSTVRTWGTFTDLSVSGCYVELKATFPVGAIIDLELELNGVRTQIKGEVRISYPFLGSGLPRHDQRKSDADRGDDRDYSSGSSKSSSDRSPARNSSAFHADHSEPRRSAPGTG